MTHDLPPDAQPVAGQPSPKTGARSQPVAHVFLLGAMRIICPEGHDCTPSGTFRKALFACILLGPRGSRSRALLQTMFWPGKPSSNAAASLRTALSVLKRELRPLGDDLLEISGQAVRVRLEMLHVDALDAVQDYAKAVSPPELLEGMDLPGSDTEEFEDWLRLERSAWKDRLEAMQAGETNPPNGAADTMSGTSSGTATQSAGDARVGAILQEIVVPDASGRGNLLVPAFALVPVAATNLSPLHARMADSILDALGASLKGLCQSDIYDFRPETHRGFVSPDGPGPDYFLALTVAQYGAHLGLSLAVRDAGTEALIWDHSLSTEAARVMGIDALAISGFVDQCVDRLARLCQSAEMTKNVRAGTPYQAINLMFKLDKKSLDQADALIGKASQEDQRMVFRSLASYLDTIRVGESLTDGEPEDDQIERVLRVASNFAKEPHDALALTTAGYALDFLTADGDRAEELLVQAIEMNPTMAFCWDHLAMFHWRRGNYDKAMGCARRALHLGAHSPLRYVYETTLCMISTVRGDYETAAHYGKRALAKSPHFAGALQYTAASLAFLGQSSEAALCISRMREWEPDLSLEVFADRVLVRSDDAACTQLMAGLRRSGLT